MCDIKTFDNTLAKFKVKYNLSMASGKPSKKTQKPASEPKTKPAIAGTKAKASQLSSAAQAGAQVEAAPLKTRRKSSAVVHVDSALQNNVVTTGVATADVAANPKTMAAAAGSSTVDASPLPATAASASSVSPASLERDPAETGNTVSVGHSAAPSNGTGHRASPDAIAQLAYSYWAERGYAHGYAEEDWARAEAELNGRS